MSEQVTRRHGALRDAPDANDPLARHQYGASPILLASEDYSSCVDRIRDQGGTSSCVGQAVARAIHLRAAIMGKPRPFPSALAAYYWSRARSGTPQVVDGGTSTRDCLLAAGEAGLCDEDRWPFDESAVDRAPPWDTLQAGSDHRLALTAYYRATTSLEIMAALAKGFPVVVGCAVDQAFEDHVGDAVIGLPSGPILGGHAMCACGYRPGAIKVVNSWGPSWGFGGFGWLSSEIFDSPAVGGDYWAVEVSA